MSQGISDDLVSLSILIVRPASPGPACFLLCKSTETKGWWSHTEICSVKHLCFHTHTALEWLQLSIPVQVDEVNIIVSGGAVSMAQSPLRLLTTQTQQVGTPPVMSNSANSSANNSAMGESICASRSLLPCACRQSSWVKLCLPTPCTPVPPLKY